MRRHYFYYLNEVELTGRFWREEKFCIENLYLRLQKARVSTCEFCGNPKTQSVRLIFPEEAILQEAKRQEEKEWKLVHFHNEKSVFKMALALCIC